MVEVAGFEPAECGSLVGNVRLCTNQSSYIISESPVPYHLATPHCLVAKLNLTFYKYYITFCDFCQPTESLEFCWLLTITKGHHVEALTLSLVITKAGGQW